MNIEPFKSRRHVDFLAAYTAVNLSSLRCLSRNHFLAAYTAVNSLSFEYAYDLHFLAAYTAVNVRMVV
ncbi:hypothetical protein, partial [Pseudomonas aeruginosa]